MPPSQSAMATSPPRARPTSIADILRQHYGEAYAQDWLTGQHEAQSADPSPPPPEAAQAIVRRPRGPEEAQLGRRPPTGPGSLSKALTEPLRAQLHPTAHRIYATLHQVALEVAAKRGYSPKVSSVTYHLPTELLAFELGMSRTTLWTHLKSLKAAGLVDQRGHTTTANNRRIKDGSVWSIKLRPLRGKAARLSYEDLSHPWRDLEADILSGSTVYNWTAEQSLPQKNKQGRRQVLVAWAVFPGKLQAPLDMTVQPAPAVGIEALLDVPWAPRGERNTMVDLAARAIAWLGVAGTFILSMRADESSREANTARIEAVQTLQRANDIQRSLLKLQEQAESDRKRAQLETRWRCALERESRSRVHLVIGCLGPAPASNVQILVDGHLPEDAGHFLEEAGNPIDMAPGAMLRFTYMAADGTPRISDVTVQWTDVEGKEQKFGTSV